MGGSGSGRYWHFGAKDTTDDYQILDVRRWQRDGYLEPGRWFGWQWMRDDKTVASIQVQAESDGVILSYRHRGGGGEWKSEDYPIYLDRTPCTYGGTRPGFAARLEDAGDGWRSCTVARSSPAGTATGWLIPASGNHSMSEQRGGPTKSGRGWVGSRAS